jgi:hypothetical protein
MANGRPGAPFGNHNGRGAKQWKQAIERALEKRGNGDRSKALDALAERLLSKIDEGDVSAIREFGDRMDGKSVQALEHSGPDGEPLPTTVIVKIVKSDQIASLPDA